MTQRLRIVARILLLLAGIFFLFSAFDLWFFADARYVENQHVPGLILVNIGLGLGVWFGATRL